jgi:hypothetical protein
MKKFLLLIGISIILSCGSDKSSLKQERAEVLYNRITALIHDQNDWTTEWKSMYQKIYDGRDTVFLMENSDFKISVVVRPQFIIDTTKPDTSTPARKGDSKGSWR